MTDFTNVALVLIALFVLFWLITPNKSNASEHMEQTSNQSYVPANYQKVGNLNYLKLSDALYAPNMLSSSVLASTVNANNVNAGIITADSISLEGHNIKDKLNSLNSNDSVTSELISHLESEHSSLSNLVKNIQKEMETAKPAYSANGKLSDSNLIQNIKFTNAWSSYPDNKQDGAEISNDTDKFKTLMIVGNKSQSKGNGVRTVGIWDELTVNGKLNVTGGFNGTKNTVFDWVGNGIFRSDNKNQLKDQYVMTSPGDANTLPSIISRDSKNRGLSISTIENTPVFINGRDIIKELDLIKKKINY